MVHLTNPDKWPKVRHRAGRDLEPEKPGVKIGKKKVTKKASRKNY